MFKMGRHIAALTIVVIAVLGVANCGDATAGSAVVKVGQNVITKTMLTRWLHITAVRDYQLHPLAPAPRGLVPDPPAYRLCIAYLRALAAKPLTPPSSHDGGNVKGQCEARYQALRKQALGSLITCLWLLGEGKARGLVATDKAVRQYFERTWKGEYATRAEFEKSRVFAGETLSDRLFRAKVKVISAEIEGQYHAKNLQNVAQNPALLKFLAEFPKKWAARTDCRKGYVVPNCKQYKGKLAPEAELP